MSTRRNISFENQVLKTIKVPSPNITLFQKTKNGKKFKTYFFLNFKGLVQHSNDWRIIYRKTRRCHLNLTSLKKFIKRLYCEIYVEKHILKRVRQCLLNIVEILNILVIKFKYNLETYKLNVYKTSTKQLQLIYSWAPHEISS